jgi:hypothetical protein
VIITLTISLAPRTKKNHGSVIKRGHRRYHIPSEAWTRWVDFAKIEGKPHKPCTELVNCRALFYRDALRGDSCGYYQGLADFLEKRGVVANDRLITQWDGSRLLLDREHPRTEVILESVPDTET